MTVEKYRKNYKLFKKLVNYFFLALFILPIYIITCVFVTYNNDIDKQLLINCGIAYFIAINIVGRILVSIIATCPNCRKSFDGSGAYRGLIMYRVCPKCKVDLEK